MSASNWTECPKCKAKAEAKRLKDIEDANNQYGKISPEEFLVMLTLAKRMKALDESLREDWEVGMHEDGTFSVGYGASCRTCGFSFNFEHAEKVI